MLAKAVSEIKRAGYRVGNVDAVVIAEAPKLFAPYRERIRKTMAKVLGVSLACVQVKGKTNEGLDAVGHGQAIAAQTSSF